MSINNRPLLRPIRLIQTSRIRLTTRSHLMTYPTHIIHRHQCTHQRLLRIIISQSSKQRRPHRRQHPQQPTRQKITVNPLRSHPSINRPIRIQYRRLIITMQHHNRHKRLIHRRRRSIRESATLIPRTTSLLPPSNPYSKSLYVELLMTGLRMGT